MRNLDQKLNVPLQQNLSAIQKEIFDSCVFLQLLRNAQHLEISAILEQGDKILNGIASLIIQKQPCSLEAIRKKLIILHYGIVFIKSSLCPPLPILNIYAPEFFQIECLLFDMESLQLSFLERRYWSQISALNPLRVDIEQKHVNSRKRKAPASPQQTKELKIATSKSNLSLQQALSPASYYDPGFFSTDVSVQNPDTKPIQTKPAQGHPSSHRNK